MSKVLIVDDEAGYRDHLAFGLLDEGYEVRTAPSGTEAIEIGSRYRPEVLVADWMLKEPIHGLHVSEVLRTLVPDLQTILITGFSSRDLRCQADRSKVFDFIEKPFDLDRLRRSVGDAVDAKTPPEPSRIAVMEIAGGGSITFANSRARTLFVRTRAGEGAEKLADFFPTSEPPDLETASQRWLVVRPQADEPLRWYLRARRTPERGGHLVVLHQEGEQHQQLYPVVGMLLRTPTAAEVRWPLKGHVLVVDDEEFMRHTAVTALERAGALCHTAESREEALRLFKLDADVRVVLADYDMPGLEIGRFVESLLDLRPDTVIVGHSGMDHRGAFARAGVTRFLPKPWRIEDLVDLLTGRIRHCVECGLPIPLRRPRPGDQPVSWECCGCGCRYAAVLYESSPPEVIGHVRRTD